MTHDLKCWPEHFDVLFNSETRRGRVKTFEIRLNDRDYKVGDYLKLREWNPEIAEYTGRVTIREVLYITDFPAGLRAGYVCMGISA